MALTHPWFLLGLLSLAVPIFLHFFELRRPQRIAFTNVGFIREVKIVTARQRRVKHLLVLLCRLAFLLFLVLLFCQPFLVAQKAVATGGNVQMLLDTSASMGAPGANDQPLDELAIAQARELAAVYPQATRFELGRKSQAMTADAFQLAVEQLNASGHGSSAAALLAQQPIRKAQKAEQLFVFSDFQKSGFHQRALATVDSVQQVFLVPLAGAATYNVYVDSLIIPEAVVRMNTDILIQIRLKNGGTADATACRAKVFVGERQAAVFQTSVAAGKSTTTTVRIRLTDSQKQQCRVELDDAPVAFDNTYYFTLQAAPPIRILDIAANGNPTAMQRLYANEPLFSYSSAPIARLQYGQMGTSNLLIVQGLSQLDAGLRDNIRQAVSKGSSVVLVPPKEKQGRESYTKLLRELGVSGVQWESTTATVPVQKEVAMPDLQNPFFRDVFAGKTRQTVMLKAAPVLRWSRSSNEILRFRDGDGYLAQFASGRGSVYIFAAPFDEQYSDFTTQALFVPVMYRIAMQSYQVDERPAYRLNQASVTLKVPAALAEKREQVFKLTQDSLTFIPAPRLVDGVLHLEVPPTMHQPGFYNLTREGKTETTLAFNIDKHESELAAYSAAELRQLVGPNRPNIHVYDATNGESVAARYKAERVGTPLWKYCLWAALACLLAEAIALRLLNRGSASSTPPLQKVAA